MSPRHWSPSANSLPSFICSDKLTSLSIWFARCNKGGKKPVNITWMQPKSGVRAAVSEVRQQDGNSEARCSKRIPSVTWCQSRIQTGRARLFLSVGSPLHTPGLTHAHPCTDLPLLPLCPGRFLIQAVPRPICWTEKEDTDRSHLCQALLTNDTATHTPSLART